MNYRTIYGQLIDRARGRMIEGYSELHHIVPRCLGGTNAKTNLVRLTAEEHYVAHQLLVKIHPGHFGLLGAATMMASGSKMLRRNNKVYGWLRRRFAAHMSSRIVLPESIEKGAAKNRLKVRSREFKAGVAAFHTGRKRSEETRARMRVAQVKGPEVRAKLSLAHMGKTFSSESRANMSIAQTGRVHSAETKRKMSVTATGRSKSDETRRRMSAAQLLWRANKKLQSLGDVRG